MSGEALHHPPLLPGVLAHQLVHLRGQFRASGLPRRHSGAIPHLHQGGGKEETSVSIAELEIEVEPRPVGISPSQPEPSQPEPQPCALQVSNIQPAKALTCTVMAPVAAIGCPKPPTRNLVEFCPRL